MLVSRLMHSPVVTVLQHESCFVAAARMAENRVGALIVVDNESHLAGILTDRDLVRRLIAHGKSPQTEVEEIMTKDVVTIDPLANVGEAAQYMIEKNVKRIVVVLESKVVGILTVTDIMAHDRTLAKPILESRLQRTSND